MIEIMDTTAVQQPLSATQIHFLQSLRFIKSEEKLRELKQIVSDFYFRQMEREADKWWDKNNMNNEKMDELLTHAYHTPDK